MLDGIIGQYKKLKTREKILAVLFITAIACILYHRLLYKPLTKEAATYEFQVQKLNGRLDELKAQFPALEEQRESIRKAESESERVTEEIIAIDKTIPSGGDASRLISEITRQASGFELSSVQQKMDEGNLYSRIYIELEFNTSFDNAVNFIKRVEGVSPFLKIEEISISEPTAKSKGRGLATSMLLSCLLREDTEIRWAPEKETDEAEAIEVRNIFASMAKPAVIDKKKKRKVDLELEGITYTAWSPTAIINDDVVRVGMYVGGYQVKEIGPNTVILTDGTEEITLMMER